MTTKTFTRPDDETLRRQLTPEQYAVTQHAATEQPYTNQYDKEFRPGIYVDVYYGRNRYSLLPTNTTLGVVGQPFLNP